MDPVAIYLLLLAIVGPIFAMETARECTTWNDLRASLAIDSNISSCAVTGYHRYSWFLLDMGEEKTINQIYVNGVGLKNVFLTVGDNDRSNGSFHGFAGNHECNTVKDKIPSAMNYPVTCSEPVTGRYVTLEMLSGNNKAHQLQLCEISYRAI